MNLILHLGPPIRAAGLGELLPAPLEVMLSDGFGTVRRQPDLVFVSRANSSVLSVKRVEGTPDLLIEILSERGRRRDLESKRAEYERFGVPEYWVLDPDTETLLIYRRAGGRLVRVMELSAGSGGTVQTPLLPGVSLPIGKIFE